MTDHDQSLFLRVTQADIDRLNALVIRLPIANKSAIARAAMRLGIDAIEADPAVLLGAPQPKRGGKRTGAGRRPATDTTTERTGAGRKPEVDAGLEGLASRFTGAGRKPKTKRKARELPERMAALMADGVVTQAQLARDIGLTSGSLLSRWANGGSLSAERLAALEQAIEGYEQ